MDQSGWNLVVLGLAISVVASVGGLVIVGFLLVKMPADYFCHSRPQNLWADRHPFIRWTGVLLKNILGLVTVAFGTVLSMPGVPGPGILIILVGLTLLNFPGKARLERWLITRRRIFDTINGIRRRYRRPPLYLDGM